MAQIVRHDDQRLTWEGAMSVERSEEASQAWRIQVAERSLFPPEVVGLAAMAAGVRITFATDSSSLAIAFSASSDASSPLDVVCNGELVATLPVQGMERAELHDLPGSGLRRVELWLPHYGQFRLKAIEIDDNATIERVEQKRRRWITYGSSITQCHASRSPTHTWPAIVARRMGWDLVCLGFSGQCHLDPMIARMIRDTPADYISICAGINVYGGSTLSPRTFRPALIGTVKIIREKHPTTPLAVISPIYSPPREQTPNAVGYTLVQMRQHVEEAVSLLCDAGDANIHYVNGLEIFGPELAEYLPDELHPSHEGYARLAENFLARVAQPLFR